MKRLIQSATIFRDFPVAPISFAASANASAPSSYSKVDGYILKSKSMVAHLFGQAHFTRMFLNILGLLLTCIVLLNASPSSAQVSITPNVPEYPYQVLAGSTRQINVNITGGTQKTANWSVLSTTGGASATFTTPKGADVSSVSNALATVQVNIGTTQGNCSISGSGPYTVSSTASVTVQAQSTDDPTKTAKFLFNVCANSPATLANGTSSVIVAPAYQQAYQNQPMTLQSWVMGCTNESGTWTITSEPSGGNGTLVDTSNRDTVFSASVTGRYTLQYTASCNSGTGTAIVYVSPNPMPSYASTPDGTRPHECYVDPQLTGADYEVGAGKAYTTISSTPALTGFKPGTIMRIWNTDTTGSNPSVFHEYYNVQNSGSSTQPIIICGVANSQGYLPILDGTNATAQSDVNLNADDGMIILFPGSNQFGYWQDGAAGPNYISITGLHLRNAKSTLKRYSPGGSLQSWSTFASCVNWRSGSFVDVSGNELDNCSNGIFTADNDANAWATITQNLTFMGNHVTGGGDPGYAESTHQSYLQSYYGLVEGNKMDNPSQYVGSDIKWRGVEGIFRYNYLGDGAPRLFDLVDNQDGPDYMTFEMYFADDQWKRGDQAGANVVAAYQESAQKDFIYGNELLGTTSEAAVHYAGDQGTPGLFNRNGVLYFFSNTLDNAQILFDNGFAGNGLNSYFTQRVNARNNIFWARTVGWTGLLNMEFAEFAPIILDTTTNLMRSGSFTMTTPILGGRWQDVTGIGWPNICDNTCQWPLAIPIETHLYGFTASNYLTTATQPYDATTFIPPSGSAAIGAGTANTSAPLNLMPVRWQFSVATGALTPRTDLLTIGASDPATGGVPTVAGPTFSPAAGTYSSTQNVSISTSTPGATIYYTTDGSTPTTGSQSYSGAITVSSSETISAIAVASGFSNSSVRSASYVITQGQVATPTFTPAAGTYTSTQQVAIATTTAEATIYYTTNGTTPTTSSTVYSGPVSISTTRTVSAIAVLSSYSNSAVATAAYTINLTAVATPAFSPAAGTYTSAQNVSISTSTPSATIYYTTNGSTPTTGSAVYSGPISVTATETIKAIAVASGLSNSAVATAAYTINLTAVATPAFSPAAGTYTSAQNVSISTSTPSATIYYTTNGSTPTTGSAVYSGPISVTATETIKAIAVTSGLSNSAVATAAYTINLTGAATPAFSPAAGAYTSAQNVSISTSTPSATIYYTTNGSTPTAGSTVYNGPISVSATETIKAIAVATGLSNSAVVTAAYTINSAATAMPTFSTASGTYTSAQNVSISTSTPSATIYYTTNGSTPTTGSAVFSGPISVTASVMIRAIAVATGLSNSAVATAAYTINSGGLSQAATPNFSPSAGTYTAAQNVTISSSTSSSTIYYTTNGSAPTTSSNVYSGPISVTASQTIQAIAVASGFSTSSVGSAAYTINAGGGVSPAATPAFTPASGAYTSVQSVSLNSSTPAATIYYTTNGSTPTTGSTVYSGPISVSTTQTIQAITAASGFSNSAVVSAAYTINLTGAADFSISASPTSFNVAPGTPGKTAVSIVSQNGFNSVVALSCSGLPTGTSCSFAPASVTPAGGTTSTILTISRTSTATNEHERSPFVPSSVLAAAFCFIGWKKRRRLQMLVLLAVCAVSVCFMNGCGGATFASNSTNAGTLSTITVTGTSGALQHSSTVSVKIK